MPITVILTVIFRFKVPIMVKRREKDVLEKQQQVLTLIEEITRNDGTSYYEIGNMVP
jgi:hypothetical protein